MTAPPFTPITLAKRWDCSPSHIRNMIRRGELKSFSLGRYTRISATEVDRIEQCQDTASYSIEENGLSAATDGALRLVRQIGTRRSAG